MNSSDNITGGTPDEREVYLLHAPAYIYSSYLIIAWLIIGSVGNTLSFLVWISPRVRKENSSAVYLAALSVADLCLLFFTLLVHLHYMFDMKPVYYQPVLCEIYSIPYVAAQYMSPLLVLAFTIERWIAICFPFRRDTLCTTRRACIVVAGLAIFTLALCSAHGALLKYSDGQCQRTIKASSKVLSNYTFVVEFVMGAGVPICTLVCNILVIRELRRIDRRNMSLSVSLMNRSGSPNPNGNSSGGAGDGSTNFKATTVMLLSVSFFLIFTTLPASLVYALQFVISPGNMSADMSTDPQWRRFFALVSTKAVIDQVTLSHYACNFFIYLFTGKVFRRHLQRQLLKSRCIRFICRTCCGVAPTQAQDSAIVYSAVRNSLHPDHRPSCLGNGNTRTVGAFPPRNYRRCSARSSGGSTAGTGTTLATDTLNGGGGGKVRASLAVC